MAPSDLGRLRAILEAVQSLDAEARQQYLDHACGDDAELRREVAELLTPGYLSSELSDAVGRAARDVLDPVEDDVAGRVILHYRVAQRIGQGGMGVVYRAEDTRLDRQVALKFLRGPQGPFLHEARAASALNHPSICTIYDVGDFEGRPFIAMEYLDGETLDQRIARAGTLSSTDAIAVAIQIAEGLEAAHAKGLAHRDIKPGNLMVTASGRVKILDFGLAARVTPAAVVSRETGPEPVLGTVHYMSPEQALGGPIDHRTDLFSMGVVLYQMLTGTLPFDGPTPARIVDRIVHGDPGRVPDAALDRIVRHCLAKRPDDRYPSATALLNDLRALRDRPTGWTTTQRLAAGVAAVALLAVLVWAPARFAGRSPAESAGNVSRQKPVKIPTRNLAISRLGDWAILLGGIARFRDLFVAGVAQGWRRGSDPITRAHVMIERLDDAWARRVDVEGVPVCHPDDIIASKAAANRAKDRESLPRLRAFRDYWMARRDG